MARKKKITRKPQAYSFAGAVRALNRGESTARVVRLPVDDTSDVEIKAETSRMRNVINQMISQMRTDTGSNFRVESGNYITSDAAAIIVCVTVTRISGEASTEIFPDDEEIDI